MAPELPPHPLRAPITGSPAVVIHAARDVVPPGETFRASYAFVASAVTQRAVLRVLQHYVSKVVVIFAPSLVKLASIHVPPGAGTSRPHLLTVSRCMVRR